MTLAIPDISKNLLDLTGYCGIVTGTGRGIGLSLEDDVQIEEEPPPQEVV